MYLTTAAEMREIDRLAIEKIGIAGPILMENAGLKVLFTLEKKFQGLRGKRFTVVCGKGNNGGDGLVIARHLFNSGVELDVFMLSSPEKLSGDSAMNYGILKNSGYVPYSLSSHEDLTRLRVSAEFSDIIIDAMYGTGFSGAIEGYEADVVRTLNDASATRIAIDVPSGLDATTGKVSDPTFKADTTITLGAPKLGLFLFPGISFSGEIWTADIGIPAVCYNEVKPMQSLLTRDQAVELLPCRGNDSHKGSFGHLLSLCGSREYRGAAVLAAYGALRSGVGLVTMGYPEELSPVELGDIPPEVILRPVKSSGGAFCADRSAVESFAGKYGAILAGCGWSRAGGTGETLASLLSCWKGPMILDADALNAFSELRIPAFVSCDLIITPHIGEMARLTGLSSLDVKTDPVKTARDYAARIGGTVILKSAVPVIAAKTGHVAVVSRPNSGLARGGSGDLLAGLVAGLTALGMPGFKAAMLGSWLHSEAAEAARTKLGADSMTVSELVSFIPQAFQSLRTPEKAE